MTRKKVWAKVSLRERDHALQLIHAPPIHPNDHFIYRYHKNSGTRIKKRYLQWLRVTRTGFIEALIGNLIYCHFSNIQCFFSRANKFT